METGIIHQEPMILLLVVLQDILLAQVLVKEITGVLVGVQGLILTEEHQ